MARRYRSSRSRGRSSNRDSYGHERARQHIEDARRLSASLGGTDKDVKAYFFALPASRLTAVLNAYEARYGRSPREYAEEAMPKWRSGRVTMSGTVAERLFDLLPPLMPLADKYRLTEQLWNHFGPSSKKVMRVGPEVRPEDVASAFADHINSVIGGFALPTELEQRFAWLAAGDVAVKQQLLNQLVTMERSLVAEGVRLQFPVMLDHLARDTERTTTRMAQIVKVRKHELEIVIDRDAEGIAIEDPPRPQLRSASSSTANSGGWGCLIMMGIAALVLFLLAQH